MGRRLGHMLRTRVRCRAVLAITATATASTAAAVARVLDIPPDGIIRDDSVRANLRLSVAHTNGGARSPCATHMSAVRAHAYARNRMGSSMLSRTQQHVWPVQCQLLHVTALLLMTLIVRP